MDQTKKYIIGGVVALAVVVLAAVFLRDGSDTYTRALPQNMTALARLDLPAVLEEAALSDAEQQELLQQMEAEDIAQTGLNLSKPIYAFTAASGFFGAVAAMDDAETLQAFCKKQLQNGLVSEVTQQRGFSWVTVDDRWLMAFDSEQALLMGPAVGGAQDQLRNEMFRLLQQDAKASGLQSKLYQSIAGEDNALVAVVAPELLPEEARQLLQPFHVATQEDALLRLAADLDDKDLTISAKLLSDRPEVKEQIRETNRVLRPLKGNLTDYAHDGCLAWMAMNVKGEELLELLRSNPVTRTVFIAMNMVIDVDRIVEAVEGDIALELEELTLTADGQPTMIGSGHNQLRLLAKLANTDFMQGASKWGNRYLPVQHLSPTDFQTHFHDMPVYFGTAGDVFYLGTAPGAVPAGSTAMHRLLDDADDYRFFLTIDCQRLLRLLPANDYSPYLGAIERVNLEMEDADEVTLRVRLKK